MIIIDKLNYNLIFGTAFEYLNAAIKKIDITKGLYSRSNLRIFLKDHQITKYFFINKSSFYEDLLFLELSNFTDI